MEQSFIMVKPDGVERGLIGEIVKRIEQKGFKLCAIKIIRLDEEKAKSHYAEHQGKSFFGELINFITSGPVVAMVWEGEGVIAAIRSLMGKTDPSEAAPGTIRGDLALHTNRNIIHGSDSKEAALREIALFFSSAEIIDYHRAADKGI